MNGYICIWKGKRYEVYSDTSYHAQLKCASEHGIKKSYEITVILAEQNGEPVTYNGTEF